MTDDDLLNLCMQYEHPAVTVFGNDYRYDGWVMMWGDKRNGKMRCAVEDEYGRIFIHNPSQLRVRDNG